MFEMLNFSNLKFQPCSSKRLEMTAYTKSRFCHPAVVPCCGSGKAAIWLPRYGTFCVASER